MQNSPPASRTVRIAIVQSLDGKITVAGPDDDNGFNDPMDAAICWHIEAGRMPVTKHWVEVPLPYPTDYIPVVVGSLESTETVEPEPGF